MKVARVGHQLPLTTSCTRAMTKSIALACLPVTELRASCPRPPEVREVECLTPYIDLQLAICHILDECLQAAGSHLELHELLSQE